MGAFIHAIDRDGHHDYEKSPGEEFQVDVFWHKWFRDNVRLFPKCQGPNITGPQLFSKLRGEAIKNNQKPHHREHRGTQRNTERITEEIETKTKVFLF